MVSLKLAVAVIGAFTATVSAARAFTAPHDGHMHRRAAAYYGYGSNDTATTGVVGTGTGAPLEPVVAPTTYMTSTTSYVTVTYTLGDGRAITKTITKTIEMPTTAYETHYYSTALVNPLETETTTVFHFVPSAEPTAIAPVEHVEQLTTKTMTATITSTEIAHVTKTIAPPAPVYPVASSSSLPVVKLPPYANYTTYSTVKDNKPTTFKLYSTDKLPVGPTGTGLPGCPVAHITTVTESAVTTVAGPTTIKTVYEYY